MFCGLANGLTQPTIAPAVALSWFAATGVTYQVQWAGEVTRNQWVDFGDPVAGSNEQKA
jgi:hypothetical protein